MKNEMDRKFKSTASLLGSDDAFARMGAIYSLYQIAIESEAHRVQAAAALCKYVRSKTQEKSYKKLCYWHPLAEIQTAIDVLFKDTPGETGLYPRFPNLPPANLTGARLDGTNFAKTKCQTAIFKKSSLYGADFSGAYCRDADFRNALCVRAIFADADCRDANFRKANCQEANFAKAHCQRALFSGAQCQGANFSSARCLMVKFNHAHFQDANFQGALCQGASFSKANCQGANFAFSQCQGALFNNAECQCADFRGTRCQGARFSNTICEGAEVDSMVASRRIQQGNGGCHRKRR